MSRKVRRYTKEFREEAVKLALQSKSFAKTASDLGIPTATIATWVRQLKNKLATNGNEALPNVHHLLEENRRLHKELSVVKEEREILKKASAYFALNLR